MAPFYKLIKVTYSFIHKNPGTVLTSYLALSLPNTLAKINTQNTYISFSNSCTLLPEMTNENIQSKISHEILSNYYVMQNSPNFNSANLFLIGDYHNVNDHQKLKHKLVWAIGKEKDIILYESRAFTAANNCENFIICTQKYTDYQLMNKTHIKNHCESILSFSNKFICSGWEEPHLIDELKKKSTDIRLKYQRFEQFNEKVWNILSQVVNLINAFNGEKSNFLEITETLFIPFFNQAISYYEKSYNLDVRLSTEAMILLKNDINNINTFNLSDQDFNKYYRENRESFNILINKIFSEMIKLVNLYREYETEVIEEFNIFFRKFTDEFPLNKTTKLRNEKGLLPTIYKYHNNRNKVFVFAGTAHFFKKEVGSNSLSSNFTVEKGDIQETLHNGLSNIPHIFFIPK